MSKKGRAPDTLSKDKQGKYKIGALGINSFDCFGHYHSSATCDECVNLQACIMATSW